MEYAVMLYVQAPLKHRPCERTIAWKNLVQKAAKKWFVSRQPMGAGTDEIGSLIIYLLSDAGSYATGQPFIVDGGTIA